MSNWGFTAVEADLISTPSGDLICVARTDHAGVAPEDTRHTVMARSSDGGRTWTTPTPVAPYSVRPQLIPLAGGHTALLYGRPGVHLLFADRECREWHSPHTVIGRHMNEFRAFSHVAGGNLYRLAFGNDTCGNARHVVLDETSFLVAYSDFSMRDETGRMRKVIKVRRISVG